MTESDEQKMILEELKADIKKEVGSESDSDQELSNILQVLSSTCDPASNPVVVKEETEEGRVNITGVTGVIIKTEPVPAQLYVNNHVGATEAC
ncbi:hypothetical protein DPMN_093778 [Dreissena polymorpha]|uniref:Uncharacterized protein n=2 Tax=Dreissena polymorpha TaxID=45954 RepID=A0A9D4L4T7_DREPO|nr:hypothetical protein DPMN_093778 [Dreissena polymorpha]